MNRPEDLGPGDHPVGPGTVGRMGQHAVPPTTHTIELAQIAELNEHLAGSPAALVLETLRQEGSEAPRPVGRVEFEGSPAFPWVYAVLQDTGERVLLHTADLQALSRGFRLHHHWGL